MGRYGIGVYGTAKYGPEAPYQPEIIWLLDIDWDGDGEFDGRNDAHNRMISCNIRRGREQFMTQNGVVPYSPGSATIVLDNSDGRYDPWNKGSPLYPDVTPGKYCRIRLQDAETAIIHKLFYGRTTDIRTTYKDGEKYTIIKMQDALAALGDINVSAGLHTGNDIDTAIRVILSLSDWTDTQWPYADNGDGITLDWWWAWQRSALSVLQDFMVAEGGALFHQSDGYLSFSPRDWTYRRTLDLTQDTLLRDIMIPQPWDIVRNNIRVVSHKKEEDAVNDTIWALGSVVALLDGESRVFEARYRYEQFNPVVGTNTNFNHTVNAQADGGGADLTGDCPLTVPSEEVTGEGATITITNNSGQDGYITSLAVVGDALYAEWATTTIDKNDESVALYGEGRLDIDSLWIKDVDAAQDLVDFYAQVLNFPGATPMIRMVNRYEQFYLDIYDRIYLALDALGISDQFRVGGIEHETINENCSVVMTTFHLEPYIVEDDGMYKGTQVVRSGAQTISDDTDTDIEWNAEDHDVGAFHSTSANPERVTVPTGYDGYYSVQVTVQWEGSAANTRYVRIRVNDGTKREGIAADISEARIFDQHVAQTLHLTAADYVTVQVKQDSGGDLDVLSDSVLSVDFLGA